MILPPSTTFFWLRFGVQGLPINIASIPCDSIRIFSGAHHLFLCWSGKGIVLCCQCFAPARWRAWSSLSRCSAGAANCSAWQPCRLCRISRLVATRGEPLGSGWWSHPSQKLMAFYPNPDPPRFCFMPRRMKSLSASKTGSANFRARKSPSAASLTSPGSRRSCSEANCSAWPCCRTTRATNVISALTTAWGVWILGEHRTSTTCQSLSMTLRAQCPVRQLPQTHFGSSSVGDAKHANVTVAWQVCALWPQRFRCKAHSHAILSHCLKDNVLISLWHPAFQQLESMFACSLAWHAQPSPSSCPGQSAAVVRLSAPLPSSLPGQKNASKCLCLRIGHRWIIFPATIKLPWLWDTLGMPDVRCSPRVPL